MSLATNERYCTTLFIDGRSVSGEGAEAPVENPATEEIIASVRSASIAQVDEAVASAARAFESGAWSDAGFRSACLDRLADLVEANANSLLEVAVNEVGTPVSTARPLNILGTVTYLRHAAQAARLNRGLDLGAHSQPVASHSMIDYLPVGVVATIAPYNYPLLIGTSKLANIWTAGCTTVLLPSGQAPLALLRFGELAHEAGMPAGVFNVIAGGPDVGEALTANRRIDKISFTGSAMTGRRVMAQAAPNLTEVTLELGGKSAAILLPGTDYAAVAEPLHGRYLRNAGQGCGSPTRMLVEQSRVEEFAEVSQKVFAGVKTGDPWDPAVLVGPLISGKHRDWAQDFVDRAVAGGAEVAARGEGSDTPRGHFMKPVLLSNVTNQDPIARQELFAPVGVVIPYSDVDEAIAIANDSEYGLAAALFGETERCLELSGRLRVGTVTINGGGGLRPESTLCGFKDSGIGCEGGEDGIGEFLKPQHVQWRL